MPSHIAIEEAVMTLSPMSSLRITCLILVFVATVALAEAQETFVNFDFEDQAATAPPHNGALTSLPMTRSGVTLDITRPPAAPFDVLANFSSMPSTWGSRSLDPFAQPTGPAFVVNSSTPATGFQVMMGDFGDDADTLTLQAFSGPNATGTLLASNSKATAAGGSTFSHVTFGVQAPGFNSIRMIGGSSGFPNSVY